MAKKNDMKTSKYNEIFPEKEVWCRLSEDNSFPWTKALIDRYQDKIDWVCLSANNGVKWTEQMLEKYEHKIDWRTLSKASCRGIFSSKNLKRFSSKWDWSELSCNSSVFWTMEKAEEFEEFIDWSNFAFDCCCSPCIEWTETIIERHQNKIDWKSLSENCTVRWNTSMLENYKHKLDWKALSSKDWSDRHLYSSENLRKFSSKWDWSELSSNSSVQWTMAKVDEFKDFIDWNKIEYGYCGWYSEKYDILEFYEKYKEYFPASSMKNSTLWNTIMDVYRQELIEEILEK